MSIAGLSISACLSEISARLNEAAAVAKAAVTPDRARGRLCAESGSEREALRIAMDLDELLNETQTLHGAVCLIGRIERRASGSPPLGG